MFLSNFIGAKIQEILQPYTGTRPSTQYAGHLPSNYAGGHSNLLSPDLPQPRPMTLGCQRSGSEPNLLESCSGGRMHDASPRSVDDHWVRSPPGSGMKNAGSVPELDIGSHRRNPDEPPPLPPERGRLPHVQVAASDVQDPGNQCYDLPSSKQVTADAAMCYDLPPSRHDSSIISDDNFYNTPPSCRTDDNHNNNNNNTQSVQDGDDSNYDVPPTERKQNSKRTSKKHFKEGSLQQNIDKVSEDELYNVPKSELEKRSNIPNSATIGASEELYNVPKETKDEKKSPSDNDNTLPAAVANEVYDPPAGRNVAKSVYANCAALDKSNKPLHQSYLADQTYDIPPGKENRSSRTAPVPKARTGSKKSSPAGQLPGMPVTGNIVENTYNVPPSTHSELSHLHISQQPSVDTSNQTYDVPPAGLPTADSQLNDIQAKNEIDCRASLDQTYDTPPQIPPVPAKRFPPAPPKPPRPTPGSLKVKPTARASVEIKADTGSAICGFIVAESSVADKESHQGDEVEKDRVTDLPPGSTRSKDLVKRYASFCT